jgi:asparagine synthase (glutamine-hydrolysing)
MCGIAGKIYYPNKTIEKSILKDIQNELYHRGPDGMGEYVDQNVALTMRRLSIIDIEGGNQPLYNENKTISIVANGEIYNYVELQKTLKSKGHKFNSKGDIETIVHAYEEWGSNFISKLRGMFTFALYDINKNIVILARDRLGEKPLYYSETKDAIIFASELKALLKDGSVSRKLNWNAIDKYFHYYFIPEPETAFINIKKVPSGSLIEIDTNKMIHKLKIYWNPKTIRPINKADPTKIIKKTFSEACELTIRSDVAVGISLSGGMDSGSILSICAPKYKDRMKAFCVGYENAPSSDERGVAKQLADKFNVDFIEKELKTSSMVNNFPQLVFSADDPIADIASFAIYSVARLANDNKVKVILGGLGGDELFWGYPDTINATFANIKNVPDNTKDNPIFDYRNPNPLLVGKSLENLYHWIFSMRIKKLKDTRYAKWPKSKSKLLISKHSMDLVRDIWLKSDPIALNDRLSMAASVEARSPFLDYKLLEAVLSSKLAVEGYKKPSKYWFKKAMEGVLPQKVMKRRKHGFTPPVDNWLRAIIERYKNYLKNGFLTSNKILNSNKLKQVLDDSIIIPKYSLYQLILLEIWGREFVWGDEPKNII